MLIPLTKWKGIYPKVLWKVEVCETNVWIRFHDQALAMKKYLSKKLHGNYFVCCIIATKIFKSKQKKNNLHSRDLTNFCILSILLIKTQVAKTKEIIKIDGCNVIL